MNLLFYLLFEVSISSKTIQNRTVNENKYVTMDSLDSQLDVLRQNLTDMVTTALSKRKFIDN